jgi:hypothetical protein
MDRDEMSKLYRGPTIDASYQVSVHLAKGFQRRRLKCEKLTDDRRRMPSDGKGKSLHKADLERQKSHKSESDREKKREAEKRTIDKVGLIYHTCLHL